MRILLTGASGFIGSALTAALRQRGHVVVRVLRHPPAGATDVVQADFAQVPSRAFWRPHLAGVDAVVNAVGILRDLPGQRFQALHADAPAELFRAAADAGVRTIVQISALGADAASRTGYQLSKRAADDVLRSLPVRGAVVQPSVVYGPGGSSTALFQQLAVAPLLPFVDGGRMLVQPVHVDDVVQGIVALLEDPPPQVATIAFAGPEPLMLRDYLAALRRGLGETSPLRVVPLPVPLFRLAAAAAGRVPGSMLDSETADMLLAGNTAQDNGLPQLLGRPQRAAADFVAPALAEAQRRDAVLGLWLPAVRIAVALLWLWTAAVSLGLYPVQGSLDLLARVGLQGVLASTALYGAALLDLLLGVLTLACPARWRRPLWLAQAALVVVYTGLITVFLPEFWLHPFGPLSKNVPVLAAIALLWALEPPRRT